MNKKEFITWLEKRLEEGVPGTRLPTDPELASTFRLSLSTIRRIITAFRNQGRLERIRGKGTFIPGTAEPPVPEMRPTVAEDLADNFRHLIGRGGLKNGEPLPPVTTAALQYRVSASSVTAAYRILVRDGFAHKIGRRYWAGKFSPASGTGTRRPVYIFYDRFESMDTVRRQFGHFVAYQKMERELLAYGYHPVYRPMHLFYELEKKWLENRDYPAGVVLILEYRFDLPRIEQTLSRIHAMAGGNTALLALPLNLIPSLPGTDIMLIRQHSNTQLHRLLSSFLVNKGYPSAALFYDQTVKNRKTFGSFIRFRREVKNLLPEFKVKYLVIPRPEFAERKAFLDKHIRDPEFSTAPRALSKYHSVRLSDVESEIELLHRPRLGDGYEQSLEFPVWIFDKCEQADAAVTWLTNIGKKVPEDILVISLQNDPRFMHKTITTVNEDWDTIGYIMAHAIIRDIPLARTSRGHLRTAAIIKDYS